MSHGPSFAVFLSCHGPMHYVTVRTLGQSGVLPQKWPAEGLRGLASTSADDVYDVAIIGGGMVGAALAAAIGAGRRTAGLKVALIDQAVPKNVLDSGLPAAPELRVSTLTPASIALLERVGAWRGLAPPISADFTTMQVWDDRGQGYVRYDASDAGASSMGHVVENSAIQSALLSSLETLPGQPTKLRWGTPVESIELPPYGSKDSSATGSGAPGLAAITLSSGECLRCRLVVGADGARSRTREMAGLRTVGWQYGQRGVVASVCTDEPNTTAWQSFLSTGPLALLPVRDGFSNIVWSTTPQLAKELEAMGPEEFADAVNRALAAGGPASRRGGGAHTATLGRNIFSGAMAKITESLATGVSQQPFVEPPRVLNYVGTSPKSFPLQLAHSGRYVRPRLALIGDAAHAVHPLAGQGVNLGFGDAEVLARALCYAVETGCDIGSLQLLQSQYEQPRQTSNLAMMAALDSLKRVFGLQSEALSGIRGFGLQLINSTPALRQNIMRVAMGSGF